MTQIRLAGLIKESVVDGPGIRMVVFTQGCPHACPGCHNPETHDPAGGSMFEINDIIQSFTNHRLLKGMTISGGEPLEQPEAVAELAAAVAASGHNVVLYTGYVWEDILSMAENRPEIAAVLPHLWLLIDGPFIQKLRDFNTPFAGSSNQRIIDVAASLAKGEPVIWQPHISPIQHIKK